MRVEYHPATIADLNEAVRYYNGKQPALGDRLRTEVHAAIELLREHPDMHAERRGVRRAMVKRFPYSIIYRLLPDGRIRVLVIRHHKRHPEFGAARD